MSERMSLDTSQFLITEEDSRTDKEKEERSKGKAKHSFSRLYPGAEEAEIKAQITIAPDGSYRVLVVLASYICHFLADGVAFSSAPLIVVASNALKINISTSALVYSTQIAIYFLCSPLATALVNKWGFRVIAMTGSVIGSLGLFAGFWTSRNYIAFYIFVGLITGVGLSFISTSSGLILACYFEDKRNIIMTAAGCMSSLGILFIYILNSLVAVKFGFQKAILVQSTLISIVYFFALLYRPLLTLTMSKTVKHPIRTVTFLPRKKFYGSIANNRFPTVAFFFNKGPLAASTQNDSTPSITGISRITLASQNTLSKRQIKQMILLTQNTKKPSWSSDPRTEITFDAEEEEPSSYCKICFNWRPEAAQARPLYRDDIFYKANVKKLHIYKLSVDAIPKDMKTGLEYRIAITRAVRVSDLEQRSSGLCTISCQRIFASMWDPRLLKRSSFLFFCISSFLVYAGLLVPYLYVHNRNYRMGLCTYCSPYFYLICVSNLLGKIVFSFLVNVIEPCFLFAAGILVSGVFIMVSDYTPTVLPLQCISMIMFGFFTAVLYGVQSVVLVKLYGVENLTNAIGISIMFVGFGVLLTPLAGMFLPNHSFYVGGAFITLGGIVFLLVKLLSC